MDKFKVKKEAKKLLKQLEGNVTLDSLCKKSGCLICCFNHRNMPGDEVLEHLGETRYAYKQDAFSLVNGEKKFIFLRNALSGEEKLFSALHEIGHLRLAHNLSPANTFEEKVNCENEANSFADAVLNHRANRMVKRNILLTAALTVLMLTGSSFFLINHAITTKANGMECFITATGKRYHFGCNHLQDNYGVTWMTVKEAREKGRTPCKDCVPEKYR